MAPQGGRSEAEASGQGQSRGHDRLGQLQNLWANTVKRRALRKPAPHSLDPNAAAQALVASVKGFVRAASSPYVIDKFIKSGSPILVTLLVVYLLGRLLLVPIQVISFLVGAMVPGVSKEGASLAGHSALTDLVSSAALLLMLLLRSWLHKPIYKCFIHTLRDINPPLAHQIESTPALPKSLKPPQHQQRQQQQQQQRHQQEQTRPLSYKIGRLLLLQLATTLGRRTPVFRHLVAPVMLFGSGERLLGTEAALGLAALGLLPPLAPWALAFLHLWRRSSVTGSELLTDYTSHAVPGEARDEWFRQNEVAIFCFMAPLLLLMEVPVVGPLMFLPASAAAAYLADLLQRLPGNAKYTVSLAPGSAAASGRAAASPGGVPSTLPPAVPPPSGASDKMS